MKKGIIVKPDIKDIVEAFNDAGMKIELGEKETDGIIAYNKDGKKHILGRNYSIFEDEIKQKKNAISRHGVLAERDNMKKREVLKFDIEDIIKELNDVGIRTVQRENDGMDGVYVVDEDGNEYVLGRDFSIFENFLTVE